MNESLSAQQLRDSAELAIFRMIRSAELAINEIDMVKATVRMKANERKAPLYRVINDCKKLSEGLAIGDESPQMIIDTLRFTPALQDVIDNPTEALL